MCHHHGYYYPSSLVLLESWLGILTIETLYQGSLLEKMETEERLVLSLYWDQLTPRFGVSQLLHRRDSPPDPHSARKVLDNQGSVGPLPGFGWFHAP